MIWDEQFTSKAHKGRNSKETKKQNTKRTKQQKSPPPPPILPSVSDKEEERTMLTKSNILMIGPTGSGQYTVECFIFSGVYFCNICNLLIEHEFNPTTYC